MKILLLKGIVVLAYIGMIAINFLANSLPFNNRSTGDISNQYATYFTPSGVTFSIWGVIYITLLVFVVQLLFKESSYFSNAAVQSLIIWFVISCVFNVLWLFMWHYDYITLSLLAMFGLLFSLMMVYRFIPSNETMLLITFGLYLGWISVATIANISIAIVNWDVPLFMNNELLWFIIVLIVGFGLVSTVLYQSGNVVYGIVFVWVYFGIVLKHLSGEVKSISNQGPIIFNGVLLIMIGLIVIYTFIQNGNQVFRS